METTDLVRRVEEIIKDLHRRAIARYNGIFPMPRIEYDVRGTRAGYQQGISIHFNPILLRENPETFLKTTVPHEMAHYVQRFVYPDSLTGERRRSHGNEWKSIMRFFGAPANRCHSYDATNARVRHVKKYPVYCGCQVHHITAYKINKLSRFRCKYCKQDLSLQKPLTLTVEPA